MTIIQARCRASSVDWSLVFPSRRRPSFVKIGQALSARPDLLPREYLEALSELQDRLAPFPTEVGGLAMVLARSSHV